MVGAILGALVALAVGTGLPIIYDVLGKISAMSIILTLIYTTVFIVVFIINAEMDTDEGAGPHPAMMISAMFAGLGFSRGGMEAGLFNVAITASLGFTFGTPVVALMVKIVSILACCGRETYGNDRWESDGLDVGNLGTHKCFW